MALLPEAHRLALRLLEEGADPSTIGVRLAIDAATVPLLLRIASGKLAVLMRNDRSTSRPSSDDRSGRC